MSRRWTADEIRILKERMQYLPNPYALEWRALLPRKDGDQIASMAKTVGLKPSLAVSRGLDARIYAAFREWEAEGISPGRAYRAYCDMRRKERAK